MWLGTIQVKDDGIISGLAISAFHYIRGTQILPDQFL